ncbi:TrkH family potassium uptake protein [Emcibacter sp.]|uniref:TrkH family potassium uptake protein n=1 Tax=Emcibacter sp. TaxID=1979954 RepID=UPI002AA7265D|nr:TrkH family potassium uptake protein [Emcibacter sp.]
MKLHSLLYITGQFLLALSLAMLIPLLLDLEEHNPDWQAFILSAVLTALSGVLMIAAFRGEIIQLSLKEGFILTNLIWICCCLFGALPLAQADIGLSYTDAFFETVSGLTTTGSTIFADLEKLPPGIILWRSILQWIGGIGVVFMVIILMPFLKVSGMQLFRMESSDTHEKPAERTHDLMKKIALWYLFLTVSCFLAYRLAGMGFLDALNHAMTTLSTGGFSPYNSSIGHFDSAAVSWAAIIFMMAGSLPFTFYLFLSSPLKKKPPLSQIKGFTSLVAMLSLFVTAYLLITGHGSFGHSLTTGTFHVVSLITTTGFAMEDYGLWGHPVIGLLFMITFIGGCSGSTAGGIKIFRFQIMGQYFSNMLQSLYLPKKISVNMFNEQRVDDTVIAGVILYFSIYFISLLLMTFLLALTELDFITSISSAATAIANVGPGLGELVGPAGNFAGLSDPAKWIMVAGMILGRLEFLSVIVIFTPAFWRA